MPGDSSTTLSVEEIIKIIKDIANTEEKAAKVAQEEQGDDFKATTIKVDALLANLAEAHGLSGSAKTRYQKTLKQSSAQITEEKEPSAAETEELHS